MIQKIANKIWTLTPCIFLSYVILTNISLLKSYYFGPKNVWETSCIYAGCKRKRVVTMATFMLLEIKVRSNRVSSSRWRLLKSQIILPLGYCCLLKIWNIHIGITPISKNLVYIKKFGLCYQIGKYISSSLHELLNWS